MYGLCEMFREVTQNFEKEISVAILLSSWKFLASNVRRKTGYHDFRFSCFFLGSFGPIPGQDLILDFDLTFQIHHISIYSLFNYLYIL
jgi:hypothetical protein